MTESDIIIEISRRKLSKQVLYSPDTKIIGAVEAISSTNQLQYRSKNRTIVNGVTFSIPLLPNFSSVTLLLSSINGPVTTYIGSCQIPKSDCLDSNDPDDEPTDKIYKLFSTNEDSVGKIRCLVYIQPRFHPNGEGHKQQHQHQNHTKPKKHRKRRTGKPILKETTRRTEIPQGFRFRKTDRGINWDRIRNLNMERVVMNNDTAMLMSCIDDIALGNLEDEDADPRLHHTIQLAQYSTQYLLGCQTLLNQRKTVIGEAYECFEQEEAELDMQIAKLRARNSALSREEDDLRDLQLQYTALLEDISPGASGTHKHKHKHKHMPSSGAGAGAGSAPRKQHGEQEQEEWVTEEGRRGQQESREDPWRQGGRNGTTASAAAGGGPASRQGRSSPGTQLQMHATGTDTTDDSGKTSWGGSQDQRIPHSLDERGHQSLKEGGGTPEGLVEMGAQKPPILRRIVSKEYMVGSGGSRSENPVGGNNGEGVTETEKRNNTSNGNSNNNNGFDTAPAISPGISSPPDWNKPKSVKNFSQSITDSNMDKTAGTNMSVDSLMGSRNNLYGGGVNGGGTQNSINTNIYMNDNEKTNEGNSNLGVTWSDHANATTVTTADPAATTLTAATTTANVPSSGRAALDSVSNDDDDVMTFPSKPQAVSHTQSAHPAASTGASHSHSRQSTADTTTGMMNSFSKTAPTSFPRRGETHRGDDETDPHTHTHSPLTKRAQSFDIRSGANRSDSLHSLTGMNRPSSFHSMGSMSMMRQDISLDVIHDHDDLFEHSEALGEASFLSPTAAITHHNQPLQTENDDQKKNSDDEDEDEDVHEFSFLSDVGEVTIPVEGVKKPTPASTSSLDRDRDGDLDRVTGVDQTLKGDMMKGGDKDDDDMRLLDTSDFSIDLPQRQPGPDETASKTISKTETETATVTPKKDEDFIDNMKSDHDDKKNKNEKKGKSTIPSSQDTEGVITSPPPADQHKTPTAVEISPSITIHMHRNAEDEDHDDVLQGTGTNNFTATYTSRDTESSYNDTDEFQLTGGGGGGGGGGETSSTVNTQDSCEGSPEQGTGTGQDEGGGKGGPDQDDTQSVTFDDEDKEEGDGGGDDEDDDDAFGDVTQLSTEDEPAGTEEHEASSSASSSDSKTAPPTVNPIHWLSGRAPLELVETANALDVFVSAIRFDSSEYANIPKVYIQLEFLEVLSEVSTPVTTNLRLSVLPVSFATYMSFNRETSLLLAEEIASQRENLALVVRFIEASDEGEDHDPASSSSPSGAGGAGGARVFADAIVDLWVMIEDSCSIVRQEIDIYDIEGNSCIGSTVVDVRGHHLLSRCS